MLKQVRDLLLVVLLLVVIVAIGPYVVRAWSAAGIGHRLTSQMQAAPPVAPAAATKSSPVPIMQQETRETSIDTTPTPVPTLARPTTVAGRGSRTPTPMATATLTPEQLLACLDGQRAGRRVSPTCPANAAETAERLGSGR